MEKQYSYIIADHMRTAIFALADGANIEPKGRGFTLKKLIKRSCLLTYFSNFELKKLSKIIEKLIEVNGAFYTHLIEKKKLVLEKLEKEIDYVGNFINLSTQKIDKYCQKHDNETIPASEIFLWYDAHGIPFELIEYNLDKKNKDFSKEGFNRLLEDQRNKAKLDRLNKNIKVF